MTSVKKTFQYGEHQYVIETGDIAWRPLNSSGINTLRIGLVVPSHRELTPPAGQFALRLADDLRRFAAV